MAPFNQAKKALAFEVIAGRVRAAVESKGVTQSELAKRTGVATSTVQALLSGTSMPLMVLIVVARELGASLDALTEEV